jgi:alanine racemase
MSDSNGAEPSLLRSWVEISRSALAQNVCRVRDLVPEGTKILAVVKANAYGHGVRCVVPELLPFVQWFGVACAAEAARVREFAGAQSILILSPILSGEREWVVRSGFVPVISSWEEALGLDETACVLGVHSVEVHVAVDTGMGRMGVWEGEALALLGRIRSLPRVRVTGVGTHFPSADEDPEFTRGQIRSFESLLHDTPQTKGEFMEVHLANSAGLLDFGTSCASLVRPGLLLYGVSPLPQSSSGFRAAMTWKTRITLVRALGVGCSVSYGRTFIAPRPMRVATLAVGYADGYPRSVSGKGAEVLVRGRRCAVLGRVTMDQIIVDVTECGDVRAGEEVVLLGTQGGEQVPVEEIAQKAGTIPWEIFTGVGERVERVSVE